MRQLVTKTSAVEKAARLARDGSLDAALKQYGDLYTLYPSDWSVANALGDLYVRLGRTDDAVAHFVKLAEQLEADGYTAKARAVFRKVLRVQPGNSHAQARVAELETRHLETGVVVNRAIAAARTQFLSQGTEREVDAATDVDERPPATPLPLTPFAAPGSATPPLTAGEDGSSTRATAAGAPPPNAYAQRLEPLAERWPSSRGDALPAGTQGPRETSQGPPTFEDLLDRLDPDPAEPATSFEQALDSLDPVAPAAAARPLEDALDEMDPGLLETVPDGLPAAELETPAPAVHEPVDWSADSLEPHAFDDESVDGGELQVAEEDGPADMAAEQVFMADEAAADLDPYQAFDPDVAATAAGDDAEDDPQVIEQGAIETLAADPDTGEEPGSPSEDDGREWDAYSLDEDTDQGVEPVAPSEDDADNNELAELLRALEEQTRTEGQTLSAVRPDDEPLDESVEESPGEDLELPPADASAEREPFDSDADAELELPESSEPVGPELAGPDGGGDVADFEVEGEAVAGGDGVEPVPIGVQIAGAAAEQDPGSVAIDVDVGSIDYDPGTAIEYLAAGETQTGLESPGEATPRPAEEPFTAVELQVEDEFASGLPLIELVVPVHAASEEDFEEIRITVLDGAAEAIRAGLARAEGLIAAGELAQAKALLQDAMCALPLRHAAGARLARVYRETGDFASAMECLEWVAEREPADEAAGHELAYELAVTLEAMGQRDHALGIYRELLSEVGAGFRDVAARARQLAAA